MNENQTTYPTGAQDEEEIDLVALMMTLLHKLKPILLTAVVCAVIAGGLAGVKILRGGAVSAEDQVAYEEALAEYQQKEKDYESAVQQYELTAKSNEDAQSSVQEALKQAQDYAEKSLLKNLDVYNVWTAQADLYIDSGYKIQPGSAYQNVDPTGALLAAYQKQLVSGDSMNAAADAVGVDVRYLKGVVTVELSQNDSGEYNGVMTLQAYAADQQTAEKILNALLGRLDLIHDKAAAAVCSHSVRVIDQSVTQGVSTELRALQQTSNEDVQNLQSQLVELQSARQALDDNLASAKSTWESAEEPALGGGAASSVAKYLLIGFLLGGVLACGVVVVKFLLDGMVYSASELNRSTGLPVLGALASDRTKKAGKLDAKLYQMEGRPDGSADAEMLCLMAQTIRSRAPEAKNILVTGDLPADQLEALAAFSGKTLELMGQEIEANVGRPQVSYKETITKAAQVDTRYARQTGGKGQFAHVKLTIEPNEPGKGYECVNAIVGGAIPKEYIPAIDNGIQGAMKSGVLAGYHVVDVKVTLWDGSYHEVDSSEMAFSIAGSMAFKDAMKKCDPVIMEPIMKVNVIVPDEYMGNVIGDLNSRRGQINNQESEGGTARVTALVPLSEMFGYATDLRSKTQGRGQYSMEPDEYQQVPKSVADKIMADRAHKA